MPLIIIALFLVYTSYDIVSTSSMICREISLPIDVV